MDSLTVRALTPDTWQDFEALASKHNGVWGGCWCTYFHPRNPERAQSNQCYKEALVEAGKARAALVFDGPRCVAWCQFGRPEELPNIYHRKETEEQHGRPDWRVTCLFVDRDCRKRGLSGVALAGALDLIAVLGGGTVESYPEVVGQKRKSASLLYNGTRQVFVRAGFSDAGPKGKNHCVMRKVI
jgi:hypothetical protein